MPQIPPWARIAIATVLIAAAVPVVARLEVEAGNDAWIDTGGPAWRDLQRVEALFGRSDGFVIGLLAPDALSAESFAWQERIAAAAADLPGVERIASLATATDVAVIDGELEAVPLVPRAVRSGGPWPPGARERILGHPLYAGLLVSPAGDACAIAIEPGRAQDERALALMQDRLERIIAADPAPGEALLAGLPAHKRAISRVVNRDQRLTVPLTFVVMVLLLSVFLRDARAVVVAALAVPTALIWTYSVIAATGTPLDAVLGLLPPLVMGTTVITSLHLLTGHAHTVRSGGHRVRDSLRRVCVPLSLTTVATIAGLIGLWWGAVPAVRSFALFATAGVVAAVSAPILWLWVASHWLSGVSAARLSAGPLGVRHDGVFARLAGWCARRRRGVIVTAVGVLAAAVWGITRVETDCDFLTALPASDPVRDAQVRIGDRLTGPLALEVVVALPRLPRDSDLAALARCATALRSAPGVTHVTTLADVIALVRARGGGTADDADLLDDVRIFAPAAWRQVVGPGLDGAGSTLRISARQLDGSVAAATAAGERVAALARR
ncbi:MAG: hypothetical protein H0V44_06125, partial [Planctomycetes bacterium]|nr:hypothetical protein [Planctomycetota bacterium]